jgi:cysteine desulfurase
MIYFDNCSSTQTTKLSLDEFLKASSIEYVNPGGSSKTALTISKQITSAKNKIIQLLSLDTTNYEMITTSSATEANNMVIMSLLDKDSPVILTTPYEHASVQSTIDYVKTKNNLTQLFVPLNSDYSVDYPQLINLLETNNIDLVSIIHVDNELGIKIDEQKMIRLIKQYANCPIHFDIVQSFSKFIGDFQSVDYLTISSHKIGSVKGIGGLIKHKKSPVMKLTYGGSQENNLRAGSENYPGLAAFKAQIEDNYLNLETNFTTVTSLKDFLVKELNQLNYVSINSPLEFSSPYILNISLIGYPSSVVTSFLEQNEILVSALSTCSIRKKSINNLTKLNANSQIASSSFRICLSAKTTKKEIEQLVSVITQIPKQLIRMG